MKVDAFGHAFVCGFTDSWSLNPSAVPSPTTAGVVEPVQHGILNAGFVSRLNPLGTALVYSTFVRAANPFKDPSSPIARCAAIALEVDDTDPSKVYAWVTGDVRSSDPSDPFPVTANAFQPAQNFPPLIPPPGPPALFPALAGPADAFLVKVTSFSLAYTTYLGGDLEDAGHGIALDSGAVFIGGESAAPVAPNPLRSAATLTRPEAAPAPNGRPSTPALTSMGSSWHCPRPDNARNIMRSTLALVLLLGCVADLAAQGALHVIEPGMAVDWNLGRSVTGIGDVDLDGHPDVGVGISSYQAPGVGFSGATEVVSGRTGAVLCFVAGPPGSGLGLSLDGIGDIDHDGIPDVIAGGPSGSLTQTGMARVFSGGSGAVIRDLFSGQTKDLFGWAVAGPGDLDADGFVDVVVGAHAASPNGLQSGEVYAFSGRTGAILHLWKGESATFHLGYSISEPASCVVQQGDRRESALCADPSLRITSIGLVGGLLRR